MALGVQHAHESGGDGVIVLDEQDPGSGHAATVAPAVTSPPNFDLALTLRGGRVDRPVQACSAMTSMRTTLAAAAAALVFVAAGCGGGGSSSGTTAQSTPGPNAPENSPPGDIPDNQAYVAYSPPGAGYAVKVPEGWSRITAHGATTFTDKLNSITMQTRPAAAPMTVRDAGRNELRRLAQSARGFHAGRVSTVHRSAGSAIRITYTATGRPNPVTRRTVTDAVERYVFFHRGRDLVLTLSGPKGADNVDPWRIVTDSVSWSR